MAPINFEDNIREKLQERELQPSEAAWEKLESRLGNQPETGNSKTIWWSIAAGLTGILIVASFFLNPETTPGVTDAVVEIENASEEDITEKPPLQEADIKSFAVSEEPVSEEKKGNTFTKEVITAHNEIVKEHSKEAIAHREQEEKVKLLPVVLEAKEATFMETQVEMVVARVKAMQGDSDTITPEAVETLLAEAQQAIETRRILDEAAGKVDAAALLQDVETELERSFRDQVFDMLGEGFQKIRTAVTERNN